MDCRERAFHHRVGLDATYGLHGACDASCGDVGREPDGFLGLCARHSSTPEQGRNRCCCRRRRRRGRRGKSVGAVEVGGGGKGKELRRHFDLEKRPICPEHPRRTVIETSRADAREFAARLVSAHPVYGADIGKSRSVSGKVGDRPFYFLPWSRRLRATD